MLTTMTLEKQPICLSSASRRQDNSLEIILNFEDTYFVFTFCGALRLIFTSSMVLSSDNGTNPIALRTANRSECNRVIY